MLRRSTAWPGRHFYEPESAITYAVPTTGNVRTRDKKVKSLVAFAALAAAAAVAAPASAQTLPSYLAPVTYNAGIGYSGIHTDGADLGAISLRLGADFGKYVGVEGEGSFGVVDQDGSVSGVATKLHLNDQYAGYGVVRYPLLPNANVFARIGYGHSDIKASASAGGQSASETVGVDSWNFGAGAQYFFDAKNGVRAEYTRFDFQDRGVQDADTWTVSYVRKF
jgi:hypothetical protein